MFRSINSKPCSVNVSFSGVLPSLRARTALLPSRLHRGRHGLCYGRRGGSTTQAVAAEPPEILTRDLPTVEEVDTEGLLETSKFPISEEDLIRLTKAVLATNNGCDMPELLADDFEFIAPVVGPLSKEEFTKAFASFDIMEAFPDMQFNYHHFRADPFEPNRIWYTARAKGTHTGKLADSIPATGKMVETPPQSCSMVFNEQGQCNKFTIGYVMDKTLGNTGGLGGVFGLLYGIGYGLPFPEAQPWEISFQYQVFQQAGKLVNFLQNPMAKR